MNVEEIGTDDLRHLVETGHVRDIIAVGLPGAWAVNIVSDACTQDAMTLRPQQPTATLHARYWESLEQLDRFLQEVGVVSYSVDRTHYLRTMPATARDSAYFPSGPEEFLDHELVIYLRGFLHHTH
ncbi:MAG TPA: hypothetical protein VKB34_21330 [Povalibacter sp.]|nr:hypothetical protein [Povalibacter sp.]